MCVTLLMDMSVMAMVDASFVAQIISHQMEHNVLITVVQHKTLIATDNNVIVERRVISHSMA